METIKNMIEFYESASLTLINGVKASKEDFKCLLSSVLLGKVYAYCYLYATSNVLEISTRE